MFWVYKEKSKVISFNRAECGKPQECRQASWSRTHITNRDNPNTGHTDVHFSNIIGATNAAKHTLHSSKSATKKHFTLCNIVPSRVKKKILSLKSTDNEHTTSYCKLNELCLYHHCPIIAKSLLPSRYSGTSLICAHRLIPIVSTSSQLDNPCSSTTCPTR